MSKRRIIFEYHPGIKGTQKSRVGNTELIEFIYRY